MGADLWGKAGALALKGERQLPWELLGGVPGLLHCTEGTMPLRAGGPPSPSPGVQVGPRWRRCLPVLASVAAKEKSSANPEDWV